MKKPKALQMLNADSLNDLTQGETAYFQDCEDLNILESNNYREISEAHVVALMESIQETGIQAEVALVASESSEGGISLTVEDGHHRLEAVRRLRQEAERSGRHWLYRHLPCRVRVAAADTVKGAFAIASVMRNQLRKEENLWDKLAAFERLRDAGETTSGISKLVGLDERSVRRIISLKKVPDIVRAFAKQNESTVKAATLYKLASAMEKFGNALEKGPASLLEEATKDSPERVAIAQEIAQTFIGQTETTAQGGSSDAFVSMIAFLALDQVPRSKNDTVGRQSAAFAPDEAEEAQGSQTDAATTATRPTRSDGSQTKRTKIPEGWVALDPGRLETLMSDAGIPEEWRNVVANLIASQNN
jgi:ParB-like chromosome segregation protein Spo0J